MAKVALATKATKAISGGLSAIGAHYAFPTLASYTKVVRIFVVGLTPARTLKQIVTDESPTRSDVFVEMPEEGSRATVLEPWTWLGGPGLVDHHLAHAQDPIGTIPVLKGKDREQIEWQCDVDFEVSAIKKVTNPAHMFGHHNFAGPGHPFTRPLSKLVGGGPSKPIRSGPTVIIPDPLFKLPLGWKQLYKATFRLKINGKWMTLDPDVYCEWH